MSETVEEAAAEERRQIVGLVRLHAKDWGTGIRQVLDELADAIERGDHRAALANTTPAEP